jgi:hypothetical protein
MAKFDCIADFEDLTGAEALNSAELALISACRARELCLLSDERPSEQTAENTIRGTLLRVLITGGTPECGLSNFGVWLRGAWITGPLFLFYVKAHGPTMLTKCVFEEEPFLHQAHFQVVNLSGSTMPGLNAPYMTVETAFSIADITATRTINLAGANIGGQLNCTGASLDGGQMEEETTEKWRPSVFAQGIKIGSNLILKGTTAFGAIDLNSAKILGQLSVEDSDIDGKSGNSISAQDIEVGGGLYFEKLRAKGTIDLNCAKVIGPFQVQASHFDGQGSFALCGQRMTVRGWFLWQGINPERLEAKDHPIKGEVHLVEAHLDTLADDVESWPPELNLIGLTYDRIRMTRNFVRARLLWLANGSVSDGIFHPEPYTQLAKVLFAVGHDREAKKILMERETLLNKWALQNLRDMRKENSVLIFENPLIDAQIFLAEVWFKIIGLLAGHGYAPIRALWAMVGLIVLTSCLAYQTWSTGAFAPNSAVILTSFAWQDAMQHDCLPAALANCDPNPAQTWSNDPDRGMDWASFQPLAYAADLAIPVVDLGQTSAWAPSKDRGPWGYLMWWSSWVVEGLGWLFTVLGGAAITGLIQRSRE